MAALNEAYEVLSNPGKSRHSVRAQPRLSTSDVSLVTHAQSSRLASTTATTRTTVPTRATAATAATPLPTTEATPSANSSSSRAASTTRAASGSRTRNSSSTSSDLPEPLFAVARTGIVCFCLQELAADGGVRDHGIDGSGRSVGRASSVESATFIFSTSHEKMIGNRSATSAASSCASLGLGRRAFPRFERLFLR
jgi:hypothetical protein